MADTNDLMEPLEIIAREKINDSRGWFLKTIDGNEKNNPFPCEVYVTSAKPGESKGGHYHNKAKEWFILIKGEALLTIIDIETHLKTDINLNAQEPVSIYIPPKHAHSFKNTGEIDFLLLAYTDQKYVPDDTLVYKF